MIQDEQSVTVTFSPFIMMAMYVELNRLYHVYGGHVPFDDEFSSIENILTLMLIHFVYHDNERSAKQALAEMVSNGFREELHMTFLEPKMNEVTKCDVPIQPTEAIILSHLVREYDRRHRRNLFAYQQADIDKLQKELYDCIPHSITE